MNACIQAVWLQGILSEFDLGSNLSTILFCDNQSVKGTRTYGIHYAADSELKLVGYTDSNWAGDSIDQKSTSRYVFMFGGVPICWSSKKQASIALSSTEAEYRGAVNGCIQAVWLQGILSEFDLGSNLSTILFCDNQVILRYP